MKFPPSSLCVEHLRQKLPEYMVPSAFVFLEEFPLTPNGKVDRRALPAPEYKAEEADEFIAPRNRTEERLVEIWETILGVSPISVNSDFFELGGHSCSALACLPWSIRRLARSCRSQPSSALPQ